MRHRPAEAGQPELEEDAQDFEGGASLSFHAVAMSRCFTIIPGPRRLEEIGPKPSLAQYFSQAVSLKERFR